MANKDYQNGLILGLLARGLIPNPPVPPVPPVPADDYHAYDAPITLYNGEFVIAYNEDMEMNIGMVPFAAGGLDALKGSCRMNFTLTDGQGISTTYIDNSVEHPLMLGQTDDSIPTYYLGKYELYAAMTGQTTEYSSNYPFFAMIGNAVMGMGPMLMLLPNITELFPDSGTIPNGTYNLKIELLGDYEVENSILPEANYCAAQDLNYDIDTEFITSNEGIINIHNDRVDGNVFTLNFANVENVNTALINNYVNYTSFTDFSQAENSSFTLSNALISGQNKIDLSFTSNDALDVLSGILYNVKTVNNPECAYLIYPCVMKETRTELISGDTPGIGAYYSESGSPRMMPYNNLANLINSASSIEVILNEIDDNPENDTVYTINKSDLGGSFTYEYNNISYIGFSKFYAQTEGFTKESLVSGGYATLDQLSCLDDKCGIIIYSLNGQYNITIETSTDISTDKLFRFGLKLIF